MRKVGAMRNPSKAIVALVVVGLVVSMPVGALASVQYSFDRITGNASNDVASQLSVTLTDEGGGRVSFLFKNSGPIASSICDVYFDDGALLAIAEIESSSGVKFSGPATPKDLPGGTPVGFETTVDFSADSDSPVKANGVNNGEPPLEWVKIIFNLLPDMTFGDVITAIENPTDDLSLKIGLHVQAIGTTGGSDSFITPEPPAPGPTVPEPTSLAIWGLGLAAVAFCRRRRV